MIKKIPKWRWVVLSILLFGSALSSFSYLLYNSPIPPTMFELLIIQTNTEITFTLLLIFLLISGDLCFGTQAQELLLELSPIKKALYALKTAVIICLLLFGIMIVVSIIAYFLCAGFTLSLTNRWITIGNIPGILDPLSAFSISLLLVFLRFVVLSLIIQTINSKAKNPLGFIGALGVCFLDLVVYFDLRAQAPTGFLPFEHSYLEMVVKLSPILYMSIIYSLLYWALLTAVVFVVFVLINRTKKEKAVIA